MSDKRELPTVGGPGGERCETCYHWYRKYNAVRTRGEPATNWSSVRDFEDKMGEPIGECRRYPMRVIDPSLEEGEWEGSRCAEYPPAYSFQWCGEWKAKPEATP